MRPRIAIPVPHSETDYASRALPQYEQAVRAAGGEPVPIPLNRPEAETRQLIAACDAILLPGSKADVDPAQFRAPRHPKTAASDPPRDAIDALLLHDAYQNRKPILGICYGLQILNVHRGGTLLQHIESKINHEAGRAVAVAHTATVDSHSTLARIIASTAANGTIDVNSSHHQSAQEIGSSLCIAARCPEDGIIEALEGTAPDHFVLAVQWHPERSADSDAPSQAIFRAFVQAAQKQAGKKSE